MKVVVAKIKLNFVEFLISEALINISISHDEFVSIDNVLKEHDGIQEKIKKSNNIKWIFIALNV